MDLFKKYVECIIQQIFITVFDCIKLFIVTFEMNKIFFLQNRFLYFNTKSFQILFLVHSVKYTPRCEINEKRRPKNSDSFLLMKPSCALGFVYANQGCTQKFGLEGQWGTRLTHILMVKVKKMCKYCAFS